jgi:hypothetical protein
MKSQRRILQHTIVGISGTGAVLRLPARPGSSIGSREPTRRRLLKAEELLTAVLRVTEQFKAKYSASAAPFYRGYPLLT